MKGLRPDQGQIQLWKKFQVRIDLIYEGIATAVVPANPDVEFFWSELTWFMKGLRLVNSESRFSPNLFPVRIDLIYEGIATRGLMPQLVLFFQRPNWPDLWRDCDATDGFRPYAGKFAGPNWPDLWRDCDAFSTFATFATFATSELTWFMKGLRRVYIPSFLEFVSRRSELTWFMKGLRRCYRPHLLSRRHIRVRIDLIYEGIATQDQLIPFLLNTIPVRIDLIYEGIATAEAIEIAELRSCPNWPDLWRDCDSAVEGKTAWWGKCPNWPDLWRDCDMVF